MESMQTDELFDLALAAWLEAVKTQILNPQLNDGWYERHAIKDYYQLTTEDGQKFIRIVSLSDRTPHEASRSAWAFVAKCDGETKALGSWKKGDIFKPASWKAPARHARGNIFNTSSNGPTCGITQWTGPNYL